MVTTRFTMDDVRSRTYKGRDAWWTVLLVDPLAGRLVKVTANRTSLSPTALSSGALALGLGAAWCFWEADGVARRRGGALPPELRARLHGREDRPAQGDRNGLRQLARLRLRPRTGPDLRRRADGRPVRGHRPPDLPGAGSRDRLPRHAPLPGRAEGGRRTPGDARRLREARGPMADERLIEQVLPIHPDEAEQDLHQPASPHRSSTFSRASGRASPGICGSATGWPGGGYARTWSAGSSSRWPCSSSARCATRSFR